MKKICLLLLSIAYLVIPSQISAQDRAYIGRVGDVASMFKKRADAAKKSKNGESRINLPRPGKQQLTLKVNSSKQQKSGDLFFGEVYNVKNSKFYLKIEGSVATGGIIMADQKKFYRYSSTPDGSVYLNEEDINKVLCIGIPKVEKSDSQTQSVTNPTASAAATPPNLQSLPGAGAVLYLDFDGQTVMNTVWNYYYNNGNPIVAEPSLLSETEMI
ncbi:MAG TPA: hypothetical protein VK616_08865, partial [Flavitalea sp.]|nr:hypothetical protein [Flavitalea sp.]